MESQIQMQNPRLIEQGAYSYMSNILNKCHHNRVNIYIYILNIGVLILFIIITFIVLYYCYKNKKTPQENRAKVLQEQEYILSKIKYYKDHQRSMASKSSITGLPTLDERPLY
jgi:hypothetical protein